MKYTILYIGGFELPDKNAAAQRVMNNAKLLNDLGHEVIFAGISKAADTSENIIDTKKEISGFTSYSVCYPNTILKLVKAMIDISSYLEIINSNPKINCIICYNFNSLAFERLRIFCQNRRIKCFADVTEWYYDMDRKFPMNIIKEFDTWFRMNIIQKKLDGLIVISKYLEKYYKGYECRNVVYLPTLTDCQDSKWINTYQKSQEILKMVYAGNPGRKDRIDMLVEALRVVNRPYHLDVVGISKEEYLKLYPEHLQWLTKSNSIIFHGRKSHLETLEFVKKANYSCFFRDIDRVSQAGFPTKFAEAISCGTPVITNSTSNIGDYIGSSTNGILIDQLNIQNIVNVIESANHSMIVERDTFDYRKYYNSVKHLFDSN